MAAALATHLADRIRREGPLPFVEFMAAALYDPQHGYYTSGTARPGSDAGDFTTAPHISPLFARCLTRLVAAADAALGHPEHLVLVEGGPGEGLLARDLLDALRTRLPDLYARLAYHLDERSPALRRRQQRLLAGHARVTSWEPPAAGYQGLYLCNELLDAFPVRRLVFQGGALQEVHVALEGERFVEVLVPARSAQLSAQLRAAGLRPPDGCAFEWSPHLGAWLDAVTERLGRGYLVAIDYGDEAPRLYGPHRPDGTCLAYRAHRASDELLHDPGGADITAHVNFSALRSDAEARGLRAAPLLTQRDFLFALGLAEEVAGAAAPGPPSAAQIEERRALGPLLFGAPQMGDAFKVLVLGRGADPGRLPLDPEGGLVSSASEPGGAVSGPP